jgi:hypothetical protein
MRSVVWPKMSSLTTGAKPIAAMATSARSIGACPAVSSVTPASRIARPMSVMAMAAVVGDTHVNGRATNAAKGEYGKPQSSRPCAASSAQWRMVPASDPNESGASVAAAARPMIPFMAATATRVCRPLHRSNRAARRSRKEAPSVISRRRRVPGSRPLPFGTPGPSGPGCLSAMVEPSRMDATDDSRAPGSVMIETSWDRLGAPNVPVIAGNADA